MSVAEVGARVIELATEQVGAHYVWGGAGATPNGSEGSRMRPASVRFYPNSLDPNAASVFAAVCDVQGRYVCAGRYDEGSGGIAGGRVANATDQDLIDYLAGLTNIPESDWPPFWNWFTPRRVIKNGTPGMIVWGEDCRGRRHFDCVGLVNYCYDLALSELTAHWANNPWALSIDQYKSNSGVGATISVAAGSLQPGDILTIGNHHIGLFAGDGDGSPVSPGAVVQAVDSPVGVTIGDYKPVWDGAFRLSDGVIA